MSGSSRLIEVAFYVALFTIIGLAITFSLLFFLYAMYKKRHIRYGHEDEKILISLKKKYKKKLLASDNEFIDAYCSSSDKHQLEYSNKVHNVETYVYLHPFNKDASRTKMSDLIELSEEKEIKKKKISKVFSIIFSVLLLVLIGFIVSYKLNGDLFYIGDSTYLVIQTGSMEKANEKNAYLKDNNLNNQITQFSMIGLNKINEEDIKVYDVIGFKDEKGDIIVHRLIRINHNTEENKNYYTFRGDANSSSASYELAVTYDKMVGRFDGTENYGLGVLVTYLKSSAGIVALASAIVFILSFNMSEDSIDKEYKKRFKYIAKLYDESGDIGVHLHELS